MAETPAEAQSADRHDAAISAAETPSGLAGRQPTGTAEELPRADRRTWLALVTVCVGTLMVILDSTIVNVALPAIQDDLDISQSSLTWVINAYLIPYGSLLLIAGRLGDISGRKLTFLVGVVVFVASSALCGVATTELMLVSGRFLQGVGGALCSASVLAIIVTEFPRADERAKAMGVYTFVAVAGGSVGLLLGGFITQNLSWHWIFFINLPIGALTILAGLRLIDESEKLGRGESLDWFGAVLITLAVAVGVYAIVGATDHGFSSPRTLGLGALAVLGVAAFLLLESRIANPIMPLRILRIRSLNYSNAIRAVVIVGMSASFFLGALYMERVLGYDPQQIGLAFLPLTIIIGALSMGPTPRMSMRFGDARLALTGLPLLVLGLAVLATVDEHTAYFPSLLLAFALMGAGVGLSMPPLVNYPMKDIPTADAGLASGLINVSMQLGAAFGLAALGTIAADRTRGLTEGGADPVSALVDGFQLAYLIGAIVGASSIVLMLLAMRRPRGTAGDVQPTAEPERA